MHNFGDIGIIGYHGISWIMGSFLLSAKVLDKDIILCKMMKSAIVDHYILWHCYDGVILKKYKEEKLNIFEDEEKEETETGVI